MEERELSRPVGAIGCHADVYKTFKRRDPVRAGQRSGLSVEYECKVCGLVSDNHGLLFSRCEKQSG